jgi:hypothetical protein
MGGDPSACSVSCILAVGRCCEIRRDDGVPLLQCGRLLHGVASFFRREAAYIVGNKRIMYND